MMLDRNLGIAMVAAELTPFAKTGGLADVAASLAKALSVLGNDVRVVVPRYRGVTFDRTLTDFPVELGGRRETVIMRTGGLTARSAAGTKTVPVYMIDNYEYFDREGYYSHDDDDARFALFCRAALEMLPRLGFRPDIVHCHDWHTGPIPFLLREKYAADRFYRGMASVFTIHNLHYQGNFSRGALRFLGVGDEFYDPERLEFYGTVSFMKAGLLYADAITTVSKRYAAEIQAEELGERMDGILRRRAGVLTGIVNGINIHEFNPRTDPRIYRNYDLSTLADKKENKLALQRELGFRVGDIALIGVVTRLVEQKGMDLLAEGIGGIVDAGAQLVVLGSGEPHYESLLSRLAERHREGVRVQIGFDAVLAQRIYAASDMFLMPSRFEPCGLAQLIAMRYGSIPVVRATGGLADTVLDFDPTTGTGNGFVFEEYAADRMVGAVRRALELYRDRVAWQKLVHNAMELDFSWHRSAAEYMAVYDRALAGYANVPWAC